MLLTTVQVQGCEVQGHSDSHNDLIRGEGDVERDHTKFFVLRSQSKEDLSDQKEVHQFSSRSSVQIPSRGHFFFLRRGAIFAPRRSSMNPVSD